VARRVPLVDEDPDAVCAYIYQEDDQDCGGLIPRVMEWSRS
jgi:hypothetical protein